MRASWCLMRAIRMGMVKGGARARGERRKVACRSVCSCIGSMAPVAALVAADCHVAARVCARHLLSGCCHPQGRECALSAIRNSSAARKGKRARAQHSAGLCCWASSLATPRVAELHFLDFLPAHLHAIQGDESLFTDAAKRAKILGGVSLSSGFSAVRSAPRPSLPLRRLSLSLSNPLSPLSPLSLSVCVCRLTVWRGMPPRTDTSQLHLGRRLGRMHGHNRSGFVQVMACAQPLRVAWRARPRTLSRCLSSCAPSVLVPARVCVWALEQRTVLSASDFVRRGWPQVGDPAARRLHLAAS